MVGLGQSMRRNYLSISFLLFWLKIYCKIVDLLVHALPGLFFFFFLLNLAWVVFQFENHTFQWRKFELHLVSLLPEELKSYFKIVFLIRYGVLLFFFLLYLLSSKQSLLYQLTTFFFYNSESVNHFTKLWNEWGCKWTKLFINNLSLTQ